MKLVIVESPTKARTLKRYLGAGYTIKASMGHVRDLPKSKMGVDTDGNFDVDYETVRGRGKVITELKKIAKTADEVVLAMDPDREGEAIAWHTRELLTPSRGKAPKFTRATFHEITKDAIIHALEHPTKLDMARVDAQQARRVVDRLVGYSLSPVLWRKVRRGLSAGRVQSVALRMIVEKEAEIAAFVPQEYWLIRTKLTTSGIDKKSEEFEALVAGQFIAELIRVGEDKVVVKGSKDDKGKNITYIDSKKVADPIVAALEKAKYTIEDVERKERKRRPVPPFTTSTLQQAAASRMGWSGKQTMRVAQQLYEAGHITYHRTDSTNLASQAVAAAREHIESTYGAEYLPEKPIFYKTSSKSAQEAHEAIRPTQVGTNGHLDGGDAKQAKLYALIWQRFMACQMVPAIYDQTTVQIKATDSTKVFWLRAGGSIMKFDGWRRIYKGSTGKADEDDVELPELTTADQPDLVQLSADQKATLPPPRFNDASLVKELEKQGIGRPSTYASIISVIVDRGYVERKDRRFFATAVGETVVKFLMKHFKDVMDYGFTARMEDDLDEIAEDKKDWRKVMKEFWGPFNKKVEGAKDVEREAVPAEETGNKCPECDEGKEVIRTGRFGKFLSCSRFPDCKYTKNIVVTVEGVVCPLCQKGDVVEKNSRWGKAFFGCSRYPDCDWASWKKPEPGEKLTKAEWAEMQKAREERKKKWAERRAKADGDKPKKKAAPKKKATKKKK